MTKCSYADDYKATRKPRCNCDTCWTMWEGHLAALRAEARQIYENIGESYRNAPRRDR